MEDVIKRTGKAFGANEAFMLLLLSLAAIPTSIIIFLELVTTESPEVCVVNSSTRQCDSYRFEPGDVCRLGNTSLWDYSHPLITIIGTYDLLCQAYWERCIPQLLFYLGMLPSCILAGYIADWLGRKISLIIFLFAECLFLSLLIAVRGYTGFLILRFFTGLSIGYFVNCKTIIIEGLKVEYRHTFLAAIWGFFSIGTMLLGLVSIIFVRYIDMLACVVLQVLSLMVIYMFAVDESLRWLLVKRKKEKAQYMLHKMAYQNNVTLPEYEDIPKPQDDKYNIRDIFLIPKSKMLTCILLQLSVLSFYLLTDFTHTSIDAFMADKNYKRYGIKNPETARSIHFVLSGFVNLLGVTGAAVLCRLVGRKPTVALGLLVCFVALVMMASTRNSLVRDVSSYMIRLASPGLVYLTSLYSLEVYITPLRARAVGLVVAAAAFGGILSSAKSFFRLRDDLYMGILILEIIVVFYLFVVSMSLPETRGCKLPIDIEDMPGVGTWCGKRGEKRPLLEAKPGISQNGKDLDSSDSLEITETKIG